MEIEDSEMLPKICISPIEKFMDEFEGSGRDLRGLFTIPKVNNFEGNIHQQVCNSSKNQYDAPNGEIALFGLSLEISNINKETSLLQPSAREFWEEEEIRKSLLNFLVSWSRNPMVYAKRQKLIRMKLQQD